MVYGTQNIQEQKILYVYFEVSRKNISSLSFCIVIVNALKNNQSMKWLENTFKMCRLLTILRLERFVETGVRDLENELFF